MRRGARDSCVLCIPPELIKRFRFLADTGSGRGDPKARELSQGAVRGAPGPSAPARWVSYTRALCASAENGGSDRFCLGNEGEATNERRVGEDDSLAL